MSEIASTSKAKVWLQSHRRRMEQLEERERLDFICPKCGTKGHLVEDEGKAVCVRTGNNWPMGDIEWRSQEAEKEPLH